MKSKCSIIIPFHNEAENLAILIDRLHEVIDDSFEIIFVDDGSTDDSITVLEKALEKAKLIDQSTVFRFHARQGKGIALKKGVKLSSGQTVIFMDADLQDDPQEIGSFIKKIEDGYQVVNGWRKKRLDGSDKTLPSAIGNKFIWRTLLKSKFHDMNCGFKAIKREVLQAVPLYGDNYRFFPYLAEKKGFLTTEIVVNHLPRVHGVSKYNAARLFLGLIDSLSTYVIVRFSQKPLHFFGLIGGFIFTLGFIIAFKLSFDWLFFGEVLSSRPLFLVSIFLMIIGIQIIMTGIVAEIIVYLHSSKNDQ